ncbi:MAG TPA: hypothetical protein DCX19_07295 [Alphaproteobacteria bacterium]|nr:hypothetical protein [Alphaproteobacteria bacterium]
MEIDENTKQAIQKVVRPLITSAVAFAAVGAVTAAVSKMLVTNVKESGLTGDKEMKPTDDDMTVSKVETAASETEGKLAKDGVAAQDASVKAAETEAKAATGEATAAETGAQALRTKAGASDIEVKALKMT